MRAFFHGWAWVFLSFGLAGPVFSGETNVLDGRIFTGSSDYSARTNDDLINNVVRKVDAVILGSLDGPSHMVSFGHKPVFLVTVLECFKSSLKPGGKIFVLMQGDGESPDAREVLTSGNNGFFFINARRESARDDGGI